MNNNFNANRLRMLIRQQWTGNKKTYAYLWGVIALAIVTITILSKNTDPLELNIILFCFGGCIMATTAFPQWTDFGRSATFLLLPASHTEKFLCSLFFGMILYVPLYILTFIISKYLLTYLVIMVFQMSLTPVSGMMKEAVREIASVPFSFYVVVFLALMFVQSLCMVIFIRYAKRQYLVLLFTILAVLVIYNSGMSTLMSGITHIKGGHVITPGIILTFLGPDFGYYLLSPDHQPDVEYFSFTRVIWYLNNLAWLVIFLMLYLSAWFKLKEREI